jgi:hypothetical protein
MTEAYVGFLLKKRTFIVCDDKTKLWSILFGDPENKYFGAEKYDAFEDLQAIVTRWEDKRYKVQVFMKDLSYATGGEWARPVEVTEWVTPAETHNPDRRFLLLR